MRHSILVVAAFLLATPSVHAASTYTMDSFGSQKDEVTPWRAAKREIARKNYAKAIPFLLQADSDKPNDADILNLLGFTHRKTGEFASALNYYKRALGINPDHKDAHEYLGELYLETTRPDDAKRELAELVRLCPKGCSQREDLEEAITKFEMAHAQAQPPKTE